MSEFRFENDLLVPVINWFDSVAGIINGSVFLTELPWFGRRVDVAVLTQCNCTYAIELKLTNTRKAIQQAIYNKISFDFSYVATASHPSEKLCNYAGRHGVGILWAKRSGSILIREADKYIASPSARERLVGKMLTLGKAGA